MYDAGKILSGLIVFLALVTAPLWLNAVAGEQAVAPKLELPKGKTQCIEATATMRASHMELLNRWRDAAVRSDDRYVTGLDGGRYERSLSRTCLSCHSNKAEFCDRCHDYLAVAPYCWDCHVVPGAQGVLAAAPEAGGGER